MDSPSRKMEFPAGMRFHPTDVELLVRYLLKMVSREPLESEFVVKLDIYTFYPEDLKRQAYFSEELNWYFFCSAGSKYRSGGRKNRTAPRGYWKPTGNDRVVSKGRMIVGHVKTLVFYEGKPAKGVRTDWVMHEYRLEPSLLKAARLKAAELGNDGESAEVVVCKIFNKGGFGPRNGEDYGTAYNEDEWNNALESIFAEMNENDPISADVNTTTTAEQVQSDVVSTSNGVAFPTNPIAAPEIAPCSGDLVGDPFCDKWCPDDFFGDLDDLVSLDATTEKLHIEEMFSAAEFGVPPINLADYPHTSFDEFDM